MMQVYPSAGYKFEFNPVIKSPITIYGPNQKKYVAYQDRLKLIVVHIK